jgi:hypothetical protein
MDGDKPRQLGDLRNNLREVIRRNPLLSVVLGGIVGAIFSFSLMLLLRNQNHFLRNANIEERTSPSDSSASYDSDSSNDLTAKLPFTVADPVPQEGGYIAFPVVVENKTGQPLSYVQVDCEFYNSDGKLMNTAYTNWSGIALDARMSGEILLAVFNTGMPAKRICHLKTDV